MFKRVEAIYDIITAKEAMKKGLDTFYIPITCKFGHNSLKQTSDGACIECMKHYGVTTAIHLRRAITYGKGSRQIFARPNKYRKKIVSSSDREKRIYLTATERVEREVRLKKERITLERYELRESLRKAKLTEKEIKKIIKKEERIKKKERIKRERDELRESIRKAKLKEKEIQKIIKKEERIAKKEHKANFKELNESLNIQIKLNNLKRLGESINEEITYKQALKNGSLRVKPTLNNEQLRKILFTDGIPLNYKQPHELKEEPIRFEKIDRGNSWSYGVTIIDHTGFDPIDEFDDSSLEISLRVDYEPDYDMAEFHMERDVEMVMGETCSPDVLTSVI